MQICKNCEVAIIDTGEREIFARGMNLFRRATLRGSVMSIMRSVETADISWAQIACLFMLSEADGLSIKYLVENVGRSLSAASRMIDQLVELKLLSRREDARDRRTKRVAITDKGRALLETIEQRRVDVQLKMLEEYRSQEERAIVLQAMVLLARASEREKRDYGQHAGATESTD